MTITKDTTTCSCNNCKNTNYTVQNHVDTIYEIRIGCMVNRLCKDCLEQLIGAAVVALNDK